jgi:hypothetical protein
MGELSVEHVEPNLALLRPIATSKHEFELRSLVDVSALEALQGILHAPSDAARLGQSDEPLFHVASILC